MEKEKEKENKHCKCMQCISNTKWRCIQCLPNKKTCCNCCCLSLTYNCIFYIQLLVSIGLHYFDVGSDFYVLVDLYSNNIYYFYTCLSILILSSFVSGVISSFFQSYPEIKAGGLFRMDRTASNNQGCCKKLFNFILGILQLGILVEVYYSFKIKEKTHTFIWSRVIEGLIESCPQSLFQLFITLKNAEIYSFEVMAKYYISITISLINLAFALVSFEFYRYDYEIRKGNFQIKDLKKLSLFSPYGLVLLLFRFCEVSSRMGLLACIGYIHTGYAILISIGIDWFISTLILLYHHKKDYINNKRCITRLLMIIVHCLNRVLYLPSYWKPFTTGIPGETEIEFSRDNYHFYLKFLNNLVLCVLIINHLIVSTYSLSFYMISTASITCFIISIPLIYIIILWNRKNTFTYNNFFVNDKLCPKNIYNNKFEMFNYKCSFLCCYSTKKTLSNNNIQCENKNECDYKDKNTEVKTGDSEVKTGGSEVKTGDYEVKTGGSEVKTGDNNVNIDIKTDINNIEIKTIDSKIDDLQI